MSEDDRYLPLVNRLLGEMGVAGEGLIGYEVLRGGVSGSLTFLLNFAERRLILKTTLPDSQAYVLERARRELKFLTELAGEVPLAVPRLVASHAGSDVGVSLLLAAYQPAPPAAEWTELLYLSAASQLGRFHAKFWRDTSLVDTYPWLRSINAPATDDELSGARRSWDGLRSQGRLDGSIAGEDWRRIDQLLKRVAELDAVVASLPPTLCHGDCHAGNVLLDEDGALVWADWQEVGIGRGPEDLSFFIQRAAFEGGAVYPPTMIAAYGDSLMNALGEEVPLPSIRRVMLASELRTRLLHWPAYMQQATADRVASLVVRIGWLDIRLELG